MSVAKTDSYLILMSWPFHSCSLSLSLSLSQREVSCLLASSDDALYPQPDSIYKKCELFFIYGLVGAQELPSDFVSTFDGE